MTKKEMTILVLGENSVEIFWENPKRPSRDWQPRSHSAPGGIRTVKNMYFKTKAKTSFIRLKHIDLSDV